MKKAGHKCPAFLGISGGTWLQQMQIMNESIEAKKSMDIDSTAQEYYNEQSSCWR